MGLREGPNTVAFTVLAGTVHVRLAQTSEHATYPTHNTLL